VGQGRIGQGVCLRDAGMGIPTPGVRNDIERKIKSGGSGISTQSQDAKTHPGNEYSHDTSSGVRRKRNFC